MKTKIIFILLLCLWANNMSFSQMVVIDKRAIWQVHENSFQAMTQEFAIRNQLRAARKEEEKLQKLISVVNINLARIHQAQKDISAFKQSGKIIGLIALKLKRALEELNALAKELPNSVLGTIASSKTILRLTEEIISLSRNIYYVVTDGKIKFPWLIFTSNSKDKNYIEPTDRLHTLNYILYEADRVRYIIQQIRLQIRSQNTIFHVALNLNPMSIANYDLGKEIYEQIISLW